MKENGYNHLLAQKKLQEKKIADLEKELARAKAQQKFQSGNNDSAVQGLKDKMKLLENLLEKAEQRENNLKKKSPKPPPPEKPISLSCSEKENQHGF